MYCVPIDSRSQIFQWKLCTYHTFVKDKHKQKLIRVCWRSKWNTARNGQSLLISFSPRYSMLFTFNDIINFIHVHFNESLMTHPLLMPLPLPGILLALCARTAEGSSGCCRPMSSAGGPNPRAAAELRRMSRLCNIMSRFSACSYSVSSTSSDVVSCWKSNKDFPKFCKCWYTLISHVYIMSRNIAM